MLSRLKNMISWDNIWKFREMGSCVDGMSYLEWWIHDVLSHLELKSALALVQQTYAPMHACDRPPGQMAICSGCVREITYADALKAVEGTIKAVIKRNGELARQAGIARDKRGYDGFWK